MLDGLDGSEDGLDGVGGVPYNDGVATARNHDAAIHHGASHHRSHVSWSHTEVGRSVEKKKKKEEEKKATVVGVARLDHTVPWQYVTDHYNTITTITRRRKSRVGVAGSPLCH